MRCITRTQDYASRSDEFRLFLIGDVHLGNLGSDERTLRKLVAEISADPCAYWVGLGDYCEYINLHDPRFDPRELVGWLLDGEQLSDIGRAETRRFIDITKPIKDKCLALVSGNHEDMILRHSECDVYASVVEGLADPEHEHRLDHRGFVTWRFTRRGGGTWSLRMHLTHGSNGGRKSGSTANRLEDLAGQVDGVDVIVQGHTHKAQYIPLAKFRIGRKTHEATTIHCINIPPLCDDMRYADSKDMRPVPTGYTELIIRPDTQSVQVNMRAAA